MRHTRNTAREAWPYRVYKYGASLRSASAPPHWPAALRQVVLAQHALWNACYAAWERNRTRYEGLLEAETSLIPLCEARATAKTALDDVRQRQKAARHAARRAHYPDWITDQDAVGVAQRAYREATSVLKTAEAAFRVHIRPQLTALLDTLWADIHALGQAAPLAWYNERQVTEAFRRAVEGFLRRTGGPPHPRRSLEQAHLTYHFTGPPLTWEQLFTGKTSMMQLDSVPAWVWDETLPQNPRRRASRTKGHLRISDADTLDFDVTLQRRPPVGALIKGVELVGRETLRPFAERPGRWDWTFYVLCEIPPRARVAEGVQQPSDQRRVPVHEEPHGPSLPTDTPASALVAEGRQQPSYHHAAPPLLEDVLVAEGVQQPMKSGVVPVHGESHGSYSAMTSLASALVAEGSQQPSGHCLTDHPVAARVAAGMQQPKEPKPKEPRVALDVNWRILDDDRLRVGMLYDGETCTPLYFPALIVKRWRYCQMLQRDLAAALERCKAALLRMWEEDVPLPPDLDPRGLRWAQTGQGGLLRLRASVTALPAALPCRAPTLAILTQWTTRTGKLWRELCGLQQHIERSKEAWYCVIAKQLCTQYAAIAVEGLDLKRLAEGPRTTPRLAESQKYRQLSAPGRWLLRLTHTAAREGVPLVKVNPAWTTLECAVCGNRLKKEDNTGEVYLTCPNGHRYDQDINSSIQLYRRAFEINDEIQLPAD